MESLEEARGAALIKHAYVMHADPANTHISTMIRTIIGRRMIGLGQHIVKSQNMIREAEIKDFESLVEHPEDFLSIIDASNELGELELQDYPENYLYIESDNYD